MCAVGALISYELLVPSRLPLLLTFAISTFFYKFLNFKNLPLQSVLRKRLHCLFKHKLLNIQLQLNFKVYIDVLEINEFAAALHGKIAPRTCSTSSIVNWNDSVTVGLHMRMNLP